MSENSLLLLEQFVEHYTPEELLAKLAELYKERPHKNQVDEFVGEYLHQGEILIEKKFPIH